MKKEKTAREVLEKELKGKLPLVFTKLSFKPKFGEQKSDSVSMRNFPVDAYQTNNFHVSFSYRKPISKYIDHRVSE